MGTTATLLDGTPLSGEYEEFRFSASGACTWVLFRPDDAEDWVGVFGRGELGLDGLAVSDSGHSACVLAGGVAYVVDTAKRQLLHTPGQCQLQSVIAIPGRERFLAADFIQLYAYGLAGSEWCSGRVSLDGIRFAEQDSSGLDGEVWTMNAWVPFRLEFEGLRYACEWECTF